MILLRQMRQSGKQPKFVKSEVKMILLDTSFYPLNSFRANFLLMRLHNLLDYYKFNCRKSEHLKTRHRLIDQETARLKSGRCLNPNKQVQSFEKDCT